MREDVVRATWRERSHPLSWLPAFLFSDTGSKPAYLLKAWIMAIVPSMAFAGALHLLVPDAQAPDVSSHTPVLFALLVLIAPFIETLIMAAVLALCVRIFGPNKAVLASAGLWGVLHSLSAPTWGLVIWWPFLIFSIVYLTWRPHGYWVAIGMAASVHGLQNLVPATLLLIDPSA